MNPILKLVLGDYSEVGLNNKLTRYEWIQKTLKAIPAGQKILDVGAGECPFKPYCSHLQYLSQDFSQYEGKGDGKGIQEGTFDVSKIDIVSDISSIPVESSSFDAILCSEVIEHVPNPVDAIREMVRILKPGGLLVLTAPFVSLTHFSPYHFATGFNRYFYEYWMDKYGLTIQDLTYNGNYFEFLAQEILSTGRFASQYAGIKPGLKEKIAQRILLSFLKKASAKGNASNELLAFGIMVVAKKR